MILIQIATALAIGAYVVLSKDAQPKRPDATARESFRHPADHLLDSDSRAPADNPSFRLPHPLKNSSVVGPRAVQVLTCVVRYDLRISAMCQRTPVGSLK
jgi:hypothetical protein